MHMLAFYTQPQAYAITVLSSFSPTDPRIGQDRFEENDLCTFADANQALPATRIVVSDTGAQAFIPFQDSTLTIDTPHDVDFYRFRVLTSAPAVSESIMIKVRSRPFGTGPLILDRSDIDLYVMRINASSMTSMGSVSSVGSRDSLRLFLAPGDYYVVVADYAGEVTRYSMCIQVRVSCTPPTSAAEAAAFAAMAPPRDRARDDGRTKTGWMRTRAWAVPANAIHDPRSPFRRP
jgi:hypothetical protein